MFTAIIIDDEPDAIELLELLVKKHLNNVAITGSANSVKDGITEIQNKEPDIVFLDIELNKETGFNLLNKISERNFEVIFITAYSHYAIEAFKYSAVDYILKPIDSDMLINAVNRVITNLLKTKRFVPDFNILLENLNAPAPRKMAVSTDKGITYVKISDIIQIMADGNYSNIILLNNEKIFVAKTIKDFEDQLHNRNFFRLHKSNLINLEHVTMYKRIDGGQVEMSDGSLITVPRRKRELFLQQMEKLTK